MEIEGPKTLRYERRPLGIDLSIIPFRQEQKLVISDLPFGGKQSKPYTYSYLNCVHYMGQAYSHPVTGESISFRPPTTEESIVAIASKTSPKQIIDENYSVALGLVLSLDTGVFANPPKDEDGNIILDEKTLLLRLNGAEKIREIYLFGNGFGFAPYETFVYGEQETDVFVRGGLARLLENSRCDLAQRFHNISSDTGYKNVDVKRFHPDEIRNNEYNYGQHYPIIAVATLQTPFQKKQDATIEVTCLDSGMGSGAGFSASGNMSSFGILDTKKIKRA